MSGGGGSTSTTQQNIPEELKPLATAFTNKAIGVGETGYQPFTAPRFAGLTGLQNAGIGQTANRALGGSGVIDAGNNWLTGQINADPMQATRNEFAGSNPYLQQQIDASLGDVTRMVTDAACPTNDGGQDDARIGSSGNGARINAEGAREQPARHLTRHVRGQGNRRSSE